MKKTLSLIALAALLFPAYSVFAQNKVVVIPLNSSNYVPGGVNTVTSATGRVWMDRNLGALRSALNKADPDAYGALFQWGRLNDGHAWRSSTTTPTRSNTDVPGHDSFITVSTIPYDWRTPQNDNLWQGVSGVNNPCPAGFRLPTGAEWEIDRASWSSNDAAGAFASPLKLVLAGFRHYDNGTLEMQVSAATTGVVR